jgi:hypothetical protein
MVVVASCDVTERRPLLVRLCPLSWAMQVHMASSIGPNQISRPRHNPIAGPSDLAASSSHNSSSASPQCTSTKDYRAISTRNSGNRGGRGTAEGLWGVLLRWEVGRQLPVILARSTVGRWRWIPPTPPSPSHGQRDDWIAQRASNFFAKVLRAHHRAPLSSLAYGYTLVCPPSLFQAHR